MNQNLEQIARDRISQQLTTYIWALQSKTSINLTIASGISIRKSHPAIALADYMQFVNLKPLCPIKARGKVIQVRFTAMKWQSAFSVARHRYIFGYPKFFEHE